jgi:hypothetical protein
MSFQVDWFGILYQVQFHVVTLDICLCVIAYLTSEFSESPMGLLSAVKWSIEIGKGFYEPYADFTSANTIPPVSFTPSYSDIARSQRKCYAPSTLTRSPVIYGQRIRNKYASATSSLH